MKARGYCGIGIYHPLHEENIGTLFRSAFCFEASFLFTIGKKKLPKQCTDTPNTRLHVPVFQFLSFQEFLEHLPRGAQLIGVELSPIARSLATFCHPEQAVYLLGSEMTGLPGVILDSCQHVVQIPELRTCLNVATVGSVVLYDRQTKQTKQKEKTS